MTRPYGHVKKIQTLNIVKRNLVSFATCTVTLSIWQCVLCEHLEMSREFHETLGRDDFCNIIQHVQPTINSC